MTQSEKVIAYIEKYGSINTLEAIGNFKITQLQHIIYNLKDTPDAMKSVPCPEIGNGFVKYVPDFDRRIKNARDAALAAISLSDDVLILRETLGLLYGVLFDIEEDELFHVEVDPSLRPQFTISAEGISQ